MKINPTVEQIEKLPKWAQKHIANLDRDRAMAVSTLEKQMDMQTPSKIYVPQYMSHQFGIAHDKAFIQSKDVTIDHDGIELSVRTVSERNGRQGINLNWHIIDRRNNSEVGIFPQASNSFDIKRMSREGL